MAITLQIIGHKKSGKTLIITTLIQQLTAKGYHVAAIKHDAHNAAMDTPQTDSDRMSKAGAAQVILQAKNNLFFHQQGKLPTLQQMVNFLAVNNDIVLIEGHKEAHGLPKLLLLGDNEQPHDVISTPPLQTGTIFGNPSANLQGEAAIIAWCQSYLEDRLCLD